MERGILLLLGLWLAGCSGGMSRQVLDEAYPLEDFSELRAAPDRLQGETVILGGEIIAVENRPEATTLTVLHRPLGSDRRPTADAPSAGRYLVRFDEYLDPAEYQAGRQITVAGRVLGSRTELVGKAPYRYVLLAGREIHLWQRRTPEPYPQSYWDFPYTWHPFYGYPHPYRYP